MKKKSLIESGISRENGIAFRTNHGTWALTTIDEGVMKKELIDSIVGNQSIIGNKSEGILGFTYLLAVIAIFKLSNGPLNILRAAIVLNVVVMTVMLIQISKTQGNMFKFHSAEHMAINAINDLQRVPTLEELKGYSRFSNNCGSNQVLCVFVFLVVILICTYLFNMVQSIVVLWLTVDILAIFRRLGWLNFCQYFSTKEPTERELNLAIEGLKFWYECEHDESECDE